jgi:transposase
MHGHTAKELEKIVGCQARVLNPHHLAVIYATDKEDALKLAHLVTDRPDSRLPTIAVPGDEETERRKLVSSCRREQKARTQGINRLHAAFVHAGITTVVKKDLATDEVRREAVKQLGGTERREADHLLKCLKLHEEWAAALKQEMAERTKGDKRIGRLETVPGTGPMVAFAFTAFVNAERFENGAQTGNCLGLVPRVRMSGSLVQYGG